MKTLYWDFFGPRAEATARHFHKHLDEFLETQECAGCTTGLSSEGAGHHAAFCRAPEEAAAAIERSLKPQRSEPAADR
jgi:hypothetical protein